MPIECLCFDLDDTLWPCRPTIVRAEQRLYDWMRREVPVITEHHSIDSLREHRMQWLDTHPQYQTDLSAARRHSLRALSDEFGLPSDWVEAAFQVFYHARQQVELFDDVAPALDALAQRYRLVSISNGNADIALTGVDRWFERHLAAADVGAAKPRRAMFDAMLQQTGVDASHIVMIGDHPEQDMRGARQAGWHSVWVNRQRIAWPLEDFRPDAEIIDFGYLDHALRQLEPVG